MTQKQILDGPVVHSHRFTDPEAYVSALPVFEPSFQTGRIRDFSSTISAADLGSFGLSYLEESMGVALRGVIRPYCTFIVTAIPGTERTLDGHVSPYGTMYHPATNDSFRCQGSLFQAASLGLTIDHDHLTSITTALSGRDLAPSRSATLYANVPADALRRLINLGVRIAAMAEHEPDRLRQPAPRAAFDGALGEALTRCLDGSPPAPDVAAARRHRVIMKRLDAIHEEHPDESLSLAQLCAKTGVNQRTLHMVSHRFTGMGPVQYLRSFRLTRVRQALTGADPQQTSVGDAAAAFGFWELGRFAAVYRATFGELPSETLRRAR